jgi:hypothetical protein
MGGNGMFDGELLASRAGGTLMRLGACEREHPNADQKVDL